MARPKKSETMSTVSIRLSNSTLQEIDQCAEKIQESTPLFSVTRTDAIRYLLHIALADIAKKGIRQK